MENQNQTTDTPNPPVLEWHLQAAEGIMIINSVEENAAIIAEYDQSKRYAESLQQIAEEMGAPFESGPKIVQRVKALKAQHAETLRLLEEAVEHIEGRECGEDAPGMTAWEHGFIKQIRAHLATQSQPSAQEKGTQ